ncbi:MAG: alanine:cation symporter family protein [Verrucomicrobiales bacterium]|jgi:AGCS family alanine or glycine:cation symporter|nr:alanine:cation symporter family protein [Verrucomicrobiales bacterium]MBP9223239.1 alanine:cation symporter family protein [Verrucomicrobiales bacterium]
MARLNRLLTFFALLFTASLAGAEEATKSIAERIDETVAPIAKWADGIIFYGFEVTDGVTMPIVLVVLGATAVILTVYFKFINLRGFGIALRTARGKYTPTDAPGEITHFQALSAALSATVGLGNIGGVAVAVGVGGPGATFWMILMGLCGMTTKFAECTLGVKYRKIMKNGTVKGGGMYYLRDGFKEIGMGPLGAVLAVIFAVFVIGGAFGAGNMYQANQAFDQLSNTFPSLGATAGSSDAPVIFGAIMAVLVGMVIIGGIVSIARVTAFLVPFMCGMYMLAALVIIGGNLGELPAAIETIFSSAFSNEAVTGGLIGVLIQGIRRAAFSNEAGLGSAPIAHSAVKTNEPASEGFVALLEPFVDTVVVCTMTALVIVITGTWQVSAEVNPGGTNLVKAAGSSEVVRVLEPGQYLHTRHTSGDQVEVIALISSTDRSAENVEGWVSAGAITSRSGVAVTSMAFGSVISWFPAILTVAVILFAFSTMISWSYYGQQGVMYLFSFLGEDKIKIPVVIYKLIFCLVIIVGSSASLNNILMLSDAMVFAMVIPNLIGLYFLLPVIKRETVKFLAHVKSVEGK